MKRFKIKKILKSDIFILVLLVLAFIGVFTVEKFANNLLHTKNEISQAYGVKLGPDGTSYIMDEGHGRIVHVDLEGNIIGAIVPQGYPDDFTVDSEGNVWINESQWDGMWIASESIRKYSVDGSVSVEFFYDYADDIKSKHEIFGLQVEENHIFFAMCDVDEINIVSRENGIEIIKQVYYENAFNAVSDLMIRGDELYVLDKAGIISCISISGKKSTEILYTTEDGKEEYDRIPFRFAINKEGNIYFTDIKNRSVQEVLPDRKGSKTLFSDTDTTTIYCYQIPKGQVFVLSESDHVDFIVEDELYEVHYIHDTVMTKVLKVVSVILKILFVGGVIYFIFRLIVILAGKKMSRIRLFTLFVMGLISLTSYLLMSILMNQFIHAYRTKICDQLEMAAYTVANQLYGEEIEQIDSAKSFRGEQYEHVCEVMENSFPLEIDFYKNIYCNILRMNEEENAYSVAYFDQSVGTYYPLDEEETKEVQEVYKTGNTLLNDEKEDISGTYLYVKVPILNRNRTVGGVVAVGIPVDELNDIITGMKKSIASAGIVILLLIGLLLTEGSDVLVHREIYLRDKLEGLQSFPGHLFRVMIFAVFVAYNMSATFLPVYILNRTEAIGTFDKTFMAALPITINIFTIGIMALFCSTFVRKLGIKKLGVIAGVCSIVANLILFIHPTYLGIVVGLVLDGIGVGLLTNASYIIITYLKDDVYKLEGFSIYNKACLSGINFGMMLGSILAVYCTQKYVFPFVAGVWVAVIVLIGIVGKQMESIGEECIEEELENQEAKAGIGKLISHPVVFGFFAFIQNPYIIFGGFVYYFVPLFCAERGYGEITVSLLLILYSELAVLTGETSLRFLNQYLKNDSMFIAYGINIIAVVIYAWFTNMFGLIIALVLLGISSGFGKPSQQSFFCNLDVVKNYGEDKAMGLYNFTENIGESLGSIVFGRLLVIQPMNLIVTGLGAAMALLSVGYKGIMKLSGIRRGS